MTGVAGELKQRAAVPRSEDFVAQIELVDALLDRQTEKLIVLKEQHAAAFAPFERLADKYTLTEDEQQQYAAAKEAVDRIIQRINATREKEHQLRTMRRLLRLAWCVAEGLETGRSDFNNRPSPVPDDDVRRVIEELGDQAEAELLSAARRALHPANVSRAQLRRERAQAFGPPRRGRRLR